MRSRRRRRLFKAVVGLGIAWFVVELAVLPVLPRHMSLAWRTKLPAPLRIIGQRSIHSYPPEEYVLLLGDSYAEGWGDWFHSVDRDGDPAYNASHLVADETGRDIVNFGRAGACTVSSTAYLVSKRFAALGRTRLGEPEAVVIQFYEGNDLDGSLADYIEHTGAVVNADRVCSTQPVGEYVASRAATGRKKGRFGALFFPYVITNSVKRNRRNAPFVPHPLVELEPGQEPGPYNVLRCGAHLYRVQGAIQGPGGTMTEADLELSFELLGASFAWVRERFEHARVAVLYIPSPASCYELVSPRLIVSCEFGPRPTEAESAGIPGRCDRIRARVAEVAREQGIEFLDATGPIRAEARRRPVHGPLDAHHFNRAGYEVLARVLEPWVAARP